MNWPNLLSLLRILLIPLFVLAFYIPLPGMKFVCAFIFGLAGVTDWLDAVIICREIVVSALREWMAELGKRASVAVSYIGKVKTAVQMLALLILLGSLREWTWPVNIGVVCLYVAAGLTLWSMTAYLKAAWPDLQKGMDKR